MQLIKDESITFDEWHYLDDKLPLDGAGLIISPTRLKQERAEIAQYDRPLGITLKVEDVLEEIIDDLPNFELIVLEFPVFTDGRHYSTAHLLRDRYGYTGDIRAAGDVLRDQLPFMQRCGFTSFEFVGNSDAGVLGVFDEITVFYQSSLSSMCNGQWQLGTSPATAL
jgi:uncharacterized protein (DUF934 family)